MAQSAVPKPSAAKKTLTEEIKEEMLRVAGACVVGAFSLLSVRVIACLFFQDPTNIKFEGSISEVFLGHLGGYVELERYPFTQCV